MMRTFIAFSAFVFLLSSVALVAPAMAEVVYVAVDGDDGASGGPATPFATIQRAIGSVASGDTIRLEDGRYTGAGNRDLDFGARALRLESISGDPLACVIDCGGGDGVLFDGTAAAVTDTTWIEGLRFTNAATAIALDNGYPGPSPERGCVLRSVAVDSSQHGLVTRYMYVRIQDVVIAVSGTGYRSRDTTGRVDRMRVTGAASGLVSDDNGGESRPLYFFDSKFIGNGNGIDAWVEWQTLELTDCKVDSNSAGGIDVNSGYFGVFRLRQSTVNHNSGHGIYLHQSVLLEVEETEFIGNAGTGVLFDDAAAEASFDNVTIHDNRGWGLDCGLRFHSDLSISESSIMLNDLGGCRVTARAVDIHESLVAENAGTGLEMFEGEGYWGTADWSVTNTTIANNSGHGLYSDGPDVSFANILVAGNDSLGVTVADTTGLTVSCTDVWDNGEGNWTGDLGEFPGNNGNMELDPQFCRIGDNPYALVLSSPCASANNNPCGKIGRYDAACEGPFLLATELHQYDPVTGAYVGEHADRPITVEGVVYSTPGTYSYSSGGYLQDATGGVNFWHFDYPAPIERGDLIRITGPVWPDGSGQVYVGNFAMSIVESGLAVVPTPFSPSELISDLHNTGAFVSVSAVVDSLTADRFVLRGGSGVVEVRRTPFTGVSFGGVTAGEDWTVQSPAFRDGPAIWLSPREPGDLFQTPAPDRVRYVAVTGDDNAVGGPTTPFATIQHAIDVSASGDTIRLEDGRFMGVGNRNLVFGARALRLESVSGNPLACVIDCGGEGGVVFNDSTVALTDTLGIEGIRFTNAATAVSLLVPGMYGFPPPPRRACTLRSIVIDSVQVGIRTSFHDVQFSELHITGSDYGLHIDHARGHIRNLRTTGAETGLRVWDNYSKNGDALVVEDSEIIGNGIGVRGFAEDLIYVFRDCYVDSNTTIGMSMSSGMVSLLSLVRTTVNDNGSHGIESGEHCRLWVVDSEIARNQGDGLYLKCTEFQLSNVGILDNGGWGVNYTPYTTGSASLQSTSILRNESGGCYSWSSQVDIAGSTIAGNEGIGLELAPSYYGGSGHPRVANTTITANTGHGIVLDMEGAELTGVLIADNDSLGIAVADTIGLSIVCTDIFGNGEGDWTGDLVSYLGQDGNISADPCFCQPEDANYTLCAESPCLPGNHPDGVDCGLIGAYGHGCGTPSGVALPEVTPSAFHLAGAYPNPFNPQTTIAFDLPRQTAVRLCVYDMAGRLVRELIAGKILTAGRQEAVWNGRDNRGRTVAAGVYFYRLTAGPYSETKRMVLVK